MRVAVNMPQMAANGLSENWLFKHCGDQHWQALCGSLAIRSSELRDDEGARLYPTFVAIFSRYSEPLAAVRENDVFETSVELSRFGSTFFHSHVGLFNDAARFRLEMLTAFVARGDEGRNELHRSTPRSDFTCRANAMPEAPAILTLSQRMRHGEVREYDFDGRMLDLARGSLELGCDYEPSPYADYNGANLLYFAAYPTICDTLERQLVRQHGLTDLGKDWALATSTVARDVFYYGNLDLGTSLRATLNRLDHADDTIILHMTMRRLSDGRAIADIFTRRQVLD